MLACRISEYVKYIEGLEAIEEDDKACVDNRLLLEKAWQIIANEFYDAKGRFSQASWAGQLPDTLKVRGYAVKQSACTAVGPVTLRSLRAYVLLIKVTSAGHYHETNYCG